jgi:hypothetical protein
MNEKVNTIKGNLIDLIVISPSIGRGPLYLKGGEVLPRKEI